MKYLFVGILCVAFVSCQIANKHHEVIFPDNLEYTSKSGTNKDTLLTILQGASYKIITRIDGDCPKCHPQLELWDQYIKEIREKEIPVSFYVIIPVTNKLVFEYTTEKYRYDYFFFLDGDNKFWKYNFELLKNTEETFLTNIENEILYVGNPTLDVKEKLKYYEIFETEKIVNQLNNRSINN
ncbi:MAG: hypothetical protein AB7V25_08105 [Mangrovibacterium sp.]